MTEFHLTIRLPRIEAEHAATSGNQIEGLTFEDAELGVGQVSRSFHQQNYLDWLAVSETLRGSGHVQYLEKVHATREKLLVVDNSRIVNMMLCHTISSHTVPCDSGRTSDRMQIQVDACRAR